MAQEAEPPPGYSAGPMLVYVLLSVPVAIGLVLVMRILAKKQEKASGEVSLLIDPIDMVPPPDASVPSEPALHITSQESSSAAPSEQKPLIAQPSQEPHPAPQLVAHPVIQPAPLLPPSAPAPVVKSIFISYRREDSKHISGRVYDKLSQKFGRDAVFKDVDSIPLGSDFRAYIREQVSRCSVLVVIIGKQWRGPNSSGGFRLNDQRDYLRIEVETALDRRIPVIPVLVDDAEMPSEDELPSSLADLAYYHGISIRPDPNFHTDADRLLRGIDSLLN
jgi:TIR domain